MTTAIESMEQIPLFEDLDDKSRKLFRWPVEPGEISLRPIGSGTALFYQGAEADHFFEIQSGMLKISQVTVDGRDIILGFRSAGDVVGLTMFGEYPCTAEAITPVTFRPFNRVQFYREILRSKPAREQLFRWIGKEQQHSENHVAILTMYNPMARVAAFLTMTAGLQTTRSDRLMLALDLPMNQQDIAAYLSIAPETYSRAIKKLRELEIVRSGRRSASKKIIEIVDYAKLSDLAGGRKI